MSRIEFCSNSLGEAEWWAVRDVFHSRWLGRGSQCAAFERELGEHLRAEPPLLTNCCTSALYLALRALEMPPGAEVLMPACQFVASAGAVLELGGVPVFCDVNPRTLNVEADEIERRRTANTWGVILLHYGGHPCDMGAIARVAAGLVVVEDAANAIVSTYHGRACGTLADAGIWSFDAMKELVMVDGGGLWLKDERARKRAELLRYFGMPQATGASQAAAGVTSRWWEFEVQEPSGRFISNDVLAAVGRAQLKRLPEFIARRREIWALYQAELAGVGDLLLPPEPLPDCTTSYYLYWVQTERRDELAAWLLAQDIYSTFRYYPLHLAFKTAARLPASEWVNEHTLNIPLHQNLSGADVWKIIRVIKEFYRD